MSDYTSLPREALDRFHSGRCHDAWRVFGNHTLENGVTRFAVWAPNARAVSVIGDFNNWRVGSTPMVREPDGVWTSVVDGLQQGALYKYAVVGANGATVLKADPYAMHHETAPANASRVWSIEGYGWHDGAYLKKREKRNPFSAPMSIYEMHLGSWMRYDDGQTMTYRDTADKLADYCRDMGYTHVELLPVTEYPYGGSWGYQVTGFFAPTSRYGTPQDFMYLVDTLHRAGIGVIIDWVPAHFPRDDFGLARFDGTYLYECKEPRMAEHPEWGTMIFDYAMPEVQSFLISSAMLFFEMYHIDGIRVDAVSSMLYLDYGREPGEWTPNADGGNISYGAVDFLRSLNTAVLSAHPGCMTIAEESTAFPGVTQPPYAGGLGFSFKWDMGYMHDTLDYFATDPYFRKWNHNKLTFSMMYAFSENFVLAYSHDEVVHGKKSMLDKMYGDYEQKFATLRALYGYQFAHPGKKLMFMGAEFGQFIEWNDAQGLDWLLLDYPKHRALRDYVRALNRFYAEHNALWSIEDSWEGFQWLNVDDAERSAIAFLRTSRSKRRVVCVCNFTPVEYHDFVIGLPKAGVLREVLNSDDAAFGGWGMHNAPEIRSEKVPFNGLDHSARVLLPPMSCVYYLYTAK